MTSAPAGRIESAAGQLRLIGTALWDPEDAACRIREGASVWLAAMLFTAIVAIVSWLSIQPTIEVLARDRTSGLSLEQIVPMTTSMERFQILIAIGPLLMLWVKWTVLAALIWLTCAVAGRDADRRRLFTLVVYASGVLVIEALFAIGVLVVKSPSAATLRELQPLTSLAALWPGASRIMAALLDSAGLFEVWFYAVLALGVRRLAQFSMTGALLAVVPAWACLTAVRVAFLLIR